jgi:hypothetical protein
MVARNLLYRYTNSSIVADSNSNSTAIARADLEVLRNEEEIAFKHHINKLQLYLSANSASYPEYYQSDPEDLIAQSGQSGQTFFYDQGDIDLAGPSSRCEN